MIWLLVPGLLAAVGFLYLVVQALRFAQRLADAITARTGHLILAPFRKAIWWEGVALVRSNDCVACGGLGVQYLTRDRHWGIIPPAMRDRQAAGSRPGMANIRRCPRCNGLGWRMVRPVK